MADSARRILVPLILLGLLGLPAGCGSKRPVGTADGGIGDPCTDADDCRSDLVCRTDDTCGPAARRDEGEQCTYTEECLEGLVCVYGVGSDRRPQTVCRAAGEVTEGGFCVGTADCVRGLVCVPSGFGGACRPSGEGDLDDPCTGTADCYAGLVCGPEGGCERAATSPNGPGFPVWAGAECVDDGGDPRFYFEVPRGGVLPAGHDFFRLPWPNDARRQADGLIDLRGFPHPELVGLPVDVVDRFARAAEGTLTGYGTYGTVYFRSSTSIDFDTVVGGTDRPSIYWVDLTPPADPGGDYGRLGFSWAASTGRGRYLCENWLAIRPPRGAPLRPGRTYAVVLTAGIRTAESAPMGRDPDFAALLAEAPPPAGEADLGRAWEAYAPFRSFLAAEAIDPGTLLAAAVFTTQDVPDLLAATREAVEATAVPAAGGLVLCGDGVASPCDDGLDGDAHVRGCFDLGADPGFVEIQGTFPVPVFQQGTAPYAAPEDGGGFVLDGDGRPVVQRTEEVCFSLTVPAGLPMPADGWPLVVYTHGTGGDYRTAVRSGVAEALAAVPLDGGSAVGLAVLAFDQPMHGARLGPAGGDPDLLFFNFLNPQAARGNVLQGAADGFQAARFALAFDLDDVASPTGQAIRFDPDRLYYYGHSQGTIHGVPTLALESAYSAAVLSGAGAGLIDSLLEKTSPYDVAGALRMVIADPGLDATHPALTLFQTWLEAADPLNYGRYLVSERPDGVGPKHLLMTYGVGDTYTTRNTLLSMASVIGLPAAEPLAEEIAGISTVSLPAAGNRNSGGTPVTAVLSTHDPEGVYDGHFVSTRDAAAARRIAAFFATAVRDGIPTVVP